MPSGKSEVSHIYGHGPAIANFSNDGNGVRVHVVAQGFRESNSLGRSQFGGDLRRLGVKVRAVLFGSQSKFDYVYHPSSSLVDQGSSQGDDDDQEHEGREPHSWQLHRFALQITRFLRIKLLSDSRRSHGPGSDS